MTTFEAIEKHFKDKRNLHFQSSDALQNIEGDSYLTYRKNGHVELWIGGNNGEVCLICTTNGDTLDTLIKTIILG